MTEDKGRFLALLGMTIASLLSLTAISLKHRIPDIKEVLVRDRLFFCTDSAMRIDDYENRL